jgi:serine O-acetyltransferase
MEHPVLAKLTFGENAAMYGYVRNLRYLEYYRNKKKQFWDYPFYIYRLLKHRKNCLKYQISISPNTTGYGLNLVHPGFRRLGAYLKIGNNCTFLPMVLIGKKSPAIDTANFTIGDNCYFGTGAIVMGPVVIGNNVTVAAGAVVTKDIPDNAIVAGNPATIIKYKDSHISDE